MSCFRLSVQASISWLYHWYIPDFDVIPSVSVMHEKVRSSHGAQYAVHDSSVVGYDPCPMKSSVGLFLPLVWRAGMLTRSDMEVDSHTWTTCIVGKVSYPSIPTHQIVSCHQGTAMDATDLRGTA